MSSANAAWLPPPAGNERTDWVRRVWLPWIEDVVQLEEKTVLEYGCGNGSVSLAIAARAGRYIGMDIDPDAVAFGQRWLDSAGLDGSALQAHPAEEICDALASYTGEVDVVLMYAVLEHMTLDERLAVLTTAREVARARGGVIVIIELPNRLTAFDWHSSWQPFLSQLPDELALEYLKRTERPEAHDEILAARDPTIPAAEDNVALMAMRRFGRGASFHEFEVAWQDSIDGYALASNWEPSVIAHREFNPSDLSLARTLARLRPDLDPSWSRQWIDVILAPDRPARRGPFHRPWLGAPGPASRLVQADLVSEVSLLPTAESRLHVELPEATQQVAVRVVSGWDRITVAVESLRGERAQAELQSVPGEPVTAVLDLPGWSDDLLLDLSGGAWVLGITYRGYGTSFRAG